MIRKFFLLFVVALFAGFLSTAFSKNVTAAEGEKSEFRPLVGAIRWDAWYGNVPSSVQLPNPQKRLGIKPDSTCSPDPGAETLRTLSPRRWEYRRPFFARHDEKGNLLELNGNRQEVMDQEIDYASYAGLDYWAFTRKTAR